MRTTITLEPDVEAMVSKAMADTKRGFKAVINDALRSALGSDEPQEKYLLPAYDLGKPLIDVDQAIHALDEIEDAKIIAQMQGRE